MITVVQVISFLIFVWVALIVLYGLISVTRMMYDTLDPITRCRIERVIDKAKSWFSFRGDKDIDL